MFTKGSLNITFPTAGRAVHIPSACGTVSVPSRDPAVYSTVIYGAHDHLTVYGNDPVYTSASREKDR